MFAIYSLTPAPWGDSYRFVEGFDWKDDAEKVMYCLNSVNISFNLYVIVDMSQPKMTKPDLRKMFKAANTSTPQKTKAKLQSIFKHTSTTTGRLSSKHPNKSNTPKSNPVKPTERYDGNLVLPKS